MRTKILTLLVNTLDKQERDNPTTAATRTGMEAAVIALGAILNRLTYINHRPELLQRLAEEREIRRERVAELEEGIAKLIRHNDDLLMQNANQKQRIHHLQEENKKQRDRILNQAEALRNANSLAARFNAAGLHAAPQQQRRK